MTLTMMLAEELIRDRHHEADRHRLASSVKQRRRTNRAVDATRSGPEGRRLQAIEMKGGEDDLGFCIE